MANNVRGFVINSLNQFNEYLQENILPSYSNKQSDWNTSNTNDDSYIKNKPTIPPEVTESTVAGWGFTKNTGSLTIETDPVFTASAAHGISSSDITAWNNKVSNVQGDWSVTDSSSEAYIKNKPTIPSIEGLATETYVTNKVAGIVNSAPETLDTLNELATALGNDPNFATTTATAIGNRVTKDELAGLGYVTQTTLSNQSYVTTTALSNQSYVTQTSLSSNSYAGYSYVYAAYSYIITSITDNELVISTALNNHESRIDSLENAGYITSFSESDPIFVASAAHDISSSDITAWNNKVSNVQADWNTSSSSDESYIKNKPTIPAEVTESTVSGWGFTKNAGTLTSHATHKLTATNETATSTSGTITFVESLTGTNTATSGDLTVTATRKSVTIPTVNDTTITITKGSYTGTFTTNASTAKTINIPNELPSYSSADDGKILSINSSGQLVWIMPISIYTGSGTPNNSQGNDGDIYLQTS